METNEQEPNKKQFKLSYEKYKKISFLIIEHIRLFFSVFGSHFIVNTNISGGRKLRRRLQRRRKIALRPKAR